MMKGSVCGCMQTDSSVKLDNIIIAKIWLRINGDTGIYYTIIHVLGASSGAAAGGRRNGNQWPTKQEPGPKFEPVPVHQVNKHELPPVITRGCTADASLTLFLPNSITTILEGMSLVASTCGVTAASYASHAGRMTTGRLIQVHDRNQHTKTK